jgi:hypothetical protein
MDKDLLTGHGRDIAGGVNAFFRGLAFQVDYYCPEAPH